jgi:hypothetical protein
MATGMERLGGWFRTWTEGASFSSVTTSWPDG